jgi:hypothetical protein
MFILHVPQLLDLEDPRKEIARLPYALFKPEHEWELKGEVNNVCFPTGTVLIDDTLYIYYGAADEQIACASLSISALLNELMLHTKKEKYEIPFNDIITLPVNGHRKVFSESGIQFPGSDQQTVKPEILFITSFPPRECGIATYSQDLVKALTNKFNDSFTITICRWNRRMRKHDYQEAWRTGRNKNVLNTDDPDGFRQLVKKINYTNAIRMVMIQHEFGFFEKKKMSSGNFWRR